MAENILLVTVAYKVLISWGIGAWLLSGGQAAVITAGNFITLYTALRATTMINVGGYALTAAAGMGSMAAAAQAAAIVIAPLVPVVLALEAAFALLGAYKGMAIADQETTAMGGRLGPTHTAMLVAPEAGGVEAVQESQRALESVASSRSPLGISAEQRKAEVEVVKQALGEETMAWIKEQEIQAGVVARNEEMVRKFEEQNKRMMESVRSQMSSMGKPEKGGGKGAEGAEGRVQSIMSTLNQELIKINEGAANEVLAWADKMVSELEGLQAKGTDVSEVMPKVWQVALAKEQKLQEEFGKWYAGNIGDNYAKIEYERDENTKKFVMSQETMRVISEKTGKSMVDLVAQNEATKQKISEVTTRKKALEDYAQQSKLLSLAKQYYDQMAQLSPGLAEQNFNRRQALELENKLALVAVDEMVTANKKLEPYRDQLLLMQAMVNQGKLFNLEMAQNKGFSGWAFSRAQEVEARNNISSLMSSLESGIANAWTTGFDAFLAKDKQGMAQAAGNLVKSFLSEIVKRNITMVFDQLAIKFKPEQGMVSGSQEAAVTLTQAGLSCGQNILTYAEAAAAILSKTTPGGVGGFGGGGTPMFGLGGYRMPKPGELGGTGGAEGDQLEGYKAIMAQFAHSVPKFSQGASMFLPGSTQFAGAGVRGFMDASSAASQAASQSMLSNIQFGLGVAGLGLSTIGLMTGSQELVIAGFVLQTAALLLMIASKLKIIHGGGVIAHQGLLLAHSGLAPDERIIKAQVGEGVIKRSTMNLYRNQGISFEDLNEGRLPIVLPKPRESSSSLVYSPTIHVGDGVSRDDKEWFKRELRRQKDEVYDMMRKGRRNNVRMK